jgi:hypothetical protein
MGKEVASTTNVSGEVSEVMATISGAMSKAAVADIETDINAGERAYEMQNEGEKPKPYYLGMDSVDLWGWEDRLCVMRGAQPY